MYYVPMWARLSVNYNFVYVCCLTNPDATCWACILRTQMSFSKRKKKHDKQF